MELVLALLSSVAREAERGGEMEIAGGCAWRKALLASAYKY